MIIDIFFNMVDDHILYIWFYLAKNKTETRIHLVNFAAFVKIQYYKTSKVIRFDNELKFEMKNYFNVEGVLKHMNKMK